MKRVLLAALLGGIVVFAWGALSHMVLPIGEMGISKVPGEQALIAALRENAPEAGTYLIPALEGVPQDQWPASGPAALLSWRPETSYGMGKNLVVEFASGTLAALIAAIVLCHAGAGVSLMRKGVLSMSLGVFAWLTLTVSHWTWYGISDGMLIGEGLDVAIGWLLAGLAMGALLGKRGGS